ncbi:hypothetical protein SERLADRAFT_413403 [Serpula lacrymans var. lacrymans S7.9]|uniref:Uncharacterized protein n=1 Tax=Serpula lacrymans var. lacrymans (strain S7.9) TaxID=578457 RepID=F8NL39_SERL9|nr:uncharacterized protein SERLADRAFT_413403 [Serpula lacrymans var. lacrymans S7.9]EGO28547.1 hypothetical protein SERLADRAFT_413403 [Serpula lacrymans var. lacrymans S7.9]
MESISRLRSALLTALGSRGSQHGEQELFDELLIHKPRLLELFDVGASSQQEQRELQSGRIVVGGKSLAVNSDFAQQTIFLSQQLNCSEKYVASILHDVMSNNPNIGAVNCMEATVAEFHQRRRYLADCMRYIFEAAELAQIAGASRLYHRVETFARHELIPAVKVPGGEIPLAYRIFREIDNLGITIARAQSARQNAGSNTTVSSGQGGNSALGYDILSARYDSLKYEQRTLASVYFMIGRLGYFSPNEVQKSVDWLATNPNHPMTFYILAATLAAFDTVDPSTFGGQIRQHLAMEKATLLYMKNKLGQSTDWKEPGLRATILLKWTLFLTEARHRDSTLEHREGFKTEELETQIWNAVQGDAFTYLVTTLLQMQKRSRGSATVSFTGPLQLTPEQEQLRESPPNEFKLAVLFSCDSLVRSLIAHASSELRKIKQRQEDLVFTSARTDRSRMFRLSAPVSDSEATLPPRNDIAMLFSFIGLLYSLLPPERAIQFWGAAPHHDNHRLTWLEHIENKAGKLPAFLQWAVWSTQARDMDTTMALYDMLSGLAKGQQCSELAYNFMARGGGEVMPGSGLPSTTGASHYATSPTISWGMIFGLLESWAATSSNPRGNQNQPLPGASFTGLDSQLLQSPTTHQEPQHLTIGPKDVLLAQAFLRFLSTVVSNSVAVRLAISGNAQFRSIPTLVSLIPLGIPLELKGAIFEALAAFCEPGAGLAGVEICKTVWSLMERLEVINVRAGARLGSSLLPAVKGVEVELDEVEAVYKLYPATLPFLKLLSTLIHTPKRMSLKDRVADAEPINTIPDTLGQSYRLPGIGPFVCFVIDNVFANIPHREYARPSDRWQINDLCLCFIERALASYDLESLLSAGEEIQLKKESILPLLVHPGYDIMKRLLTNSPLQASILSYIVEGVEGFEKEFSEEEPFFKSTIVRVLRILHRVLQIQDIFLDVLIPLLSEFDSAPIIGTVHPRSSFTRFDQALSFGGQYVPAVAAYVVYPAHPELVLLAVKIISQLSTSTSLPNLISLIERSSDSERILSGFRRILDVETLDDVGIAEANADDTTGAGAVDYEGEHSLEQATRLAALDLLIQTTDSRRPFPNVGHFLLFGGSESEYRIQDPHAMGAHRTCAHVILDLLNAGVPEVRGRNKQRGRQLAMQAEPLFIALPALAERCYRVIYQLCVHPRTSDSTMRYLRTREDFFCRHLAAIPSNVPEVIDDPYIEVLYIDGSRITTTVSALKSFIRLRSWILDLVALDLHVLTNKGHHKGVLEILAIVFGVDASHADGHQVWEDDMLQPFQDIGQSHSRIIEFVQSLSFDWSDSVTVNPIDLEYLGQLNLHTCIRVDASGCEVVDRTALLSLLTTARRALHSQGQLTTSAHVDKLNTEINYIMESCAIENHRREIHHSIAAGYESWRRLLDTTLMKCFDRLPHDRRENMLFDLLHVLPTIIQSPDIGEPTAVLLSEASVSAITKLREDRRHQVMLQSAGGDADAGSLPTDRLFSLLRSLLECILSNNRMELVRGNLYAALINYLHLVAPNDSSCDVSMDNFRRQSMSMSLRLSVSSSRDDMMMSNSQLLPSHSGNAGGSMTALEAGTLSVMKNHLERLITTISRDAIDGTEVWKTVAFMLLDSLVHLSHLDKSHVIWPTFVRYGILSSFVRGLKESDLPLQHVLKPDPDDLNPLYVYESKMSLLIRMTQNRLGAERLLEAQILPILAQCEFIDARPEADQSFMDYDSFLPSAIQRYHQLFMPALQLIVGMLATLGSKHNSATHQALDFLSSHRETIIILLKNEMSEVPLSFIEEVHLLVSLCGSVLPLVPKSDLLSVNSGFGGIHGAILSFAARYFGFGQETKKVKPHTDVEVLQASIHAPGRTRETNFDVLVYRRERILRKAIIEYLGIASDFTATIPTIGDALEALSNLCSDLAETLKQITDLSAELLSKDHIRVDNIQEIVPISNVEFLLGLDISQKRSLICREYERLKHDTQTKGRTLLDTMEILLLLLWRHLVHYADDQHIENDSLKTSHLGRSVPAPDAETFRSDISNRILSSLQRLSSLDLTLETIGHDWQSYQGYIDIMSRRLRDTIGLHDALE